jgi:16S rRNA (adenine1518-N6/adenine1519-N6)-dimethyltransferase
VLEVVRASFSAPRKQIRNALSHSLGIDAAKIADSLARAAIDPGARAETLGVPDFIRLSRALAPLLTRTIGAGAHDA